MKRALLLLACLLCGCEYMERMMSRSTPDTRIVLYPGQVIEVNNFGKLVKTGQDIDDFRCEHPPMFCSGSGPTMDCRCP